MRRAKAYAAERGTTLTELFETALREKLSRSSMVDEVRERRELPSYRGNGLQPGVDLHDTVALLDVMDGADS